MNDVVGKLPPAGSPAQLSRGGGVTAETVSVHDAEMAMFRVGADSPAASPMLVWVHGWGQTHEALLPLAQAM